MEQRIPHIMLWKGTPISELDRQTLLHELNAMRRR